MNLSEQYQFSFSDAVASDARALARVVQALLSIPGPDEGQNTTTPAGCSEGRRRVLEVGHRLFPRRQEGGIVWSVIVTEAATALLITATLMLPLAPMLAALPLLGIVLNGTSSVLYGTVPDLAPKGDIGRGFAMLYTSVIGTGGLAPIAYGMIADHSNRTVGLLAAALTAAIIIPLVLALRPILEDRRGAVKEQEL